MKNIKTLLIGATLALAGCAPAPADNAAPVATYKAGGGVRPSALMASEPGVPPLLIMAGARVPTVQNLHGAGSVTVSVSGADVTFTGSGGGGGETTATRDALTTGSMSGSGRIVLTPSFPNLLNIGFNDSGLLTEETDTIDSVASRGGTTGIPIEVGGLIVDGESVLGSDLTANGVSTFNSASTVNGPLVVNNAGEAVTVNGNLVVNNAGSIATIASDLDVYGSLNAYNALYEAGVKVLVPNRVTSGDGTVIISADDTNGQVDLSAPPYTETDTLDSVAGRGATTDISLTLGDANLNGGLTVQHAAYLNSTLNVTGGADIFDHLNCYDAFVASNGATVHGASVLGGNVTIGSDLDLATGVLPLYFGDTDHYIWYQQPAGGFVVSHPLIGSSTIQGTELSEGSGARVVTPSRVTSGDGTVIVTADGTAGSVDLSAPPPDLGRLFVSNGLIYHSDSTSEVAFDYSSDSHGSLSIPAAQLRAGNTFRFRVDGSSVASNVARNMTFRLRGQGTQLWSNYNPSSSPLSVPAASFVTPNIHGWWLEITLSCQDDSGSIKVSAHGYFDNNGSGSGGTNLVTEDTSTFAIDPYTDLNLEFTTQASAAGSSPPGQSFAHNTLLTREH